TTDRPSFSRRERTESLLLASTIGLFLLNHCDCPIGIYREIRGRLLALWDEGMSGSIGSFVWNQDDIRILVCHRRVITLERFASRGINRGSRLHLLGNTMYPHWPQNDLTTSSTVGINLRSFDGLDLKLGIGRCDTSVVQLAP